MKKITREPLSFLLLFFLLALSACSQASSDDEDDWILVPTTDSVTVTIAGVKTGSVSGYDLTDFSGYYPIHTERTSASGNLPTLYYTLDGSEPTTRSKVFNAANYDGEEQIKDFAPIHLRVLAVMGTASDTADVTFTPGYLSFFSTRNTQLHKTEGYFVCGEFNMYQFSNANSISIAESGVLSFTYTNDSLGSVSLSITHADGSTLACVTASGQTNVQPGDKIRVSVNSGAKYRPNGQNYYRVLFQLQ